MKRKWIALVCVLAMMLCLTACGEEETVSVTGMVVSVDGTVITLMEMDQENTNFREMEEGQMPSMPSDPEGFEGFSGGFPGGFSREGFDGTMPEGGEFSGSFPGGSFPGGEEFSGWGEGQMPSMPEGGEMPDFSGSFVGMMGSMGGINFDGKTQQIDIGDARIGVGIEGGKESGSLDDLAPGTFVTITMTAKGKVTYVLVTSTSGMTGFGGFGNFMGMSRS